MRRIELSLTQRLRALEQLLSEQALLEQYFGKARRSQDLSELRVAIEALQLHQRKAIEPKRPTSRRRFWNRLASLQTP